MDDPITITDRARRQAQLALRRQKCPVAPTGSGTWFLADRSSVEKALREVETFVGSFGTIEGIAQDEQILQWIPEPRHGRLRRIINSVMAPHRIAAASPFVTELAGRLAREAVREGRLDIVPAFVDPIPTQVIAHVLGIPTGDWELFGRYSDELLERQGTHREPRPMSEIHPEFATYVEGLVADRRRAVDPPDDMITRFIRAEIDGEELSDAAIRTHVMVLIIAGNETTRNLLGNVIATIARDPALYSRLRNDAAAIPAVIEESLRIDTPVQYLMRTCAHAADFAGTVVPAGDRVVVGVGSANLDEGVFANADIFDRSAHCGRWSNVAHGRTASHLEPGVLGSWPAFVVGRTLRVNQGSELGGRRLGGRVGLVRTRRRGAAHGIAPVVSGGTIRQPPRLRSLQSTMASREVWSALQGS